MLNSDSPPYLDRKYSTRGAWIHSLDAVSMVMSGMDSDQKL